MDRRRFLKWFGIGTLCAPVVGRLAAADSVTVAPEEVRYQAAILKTVKPPMMDYPFSGTTITYVDRYWYENALYVSPKFLRPKGA